jgi:hypothetical protein
MTGPALPAGLTCRPIELADADGFYDGSDVDLAYEIVRRVEEGLLAEPDSTRESGPAPADQPEAAIEEHRLILDTSGRPTGLLLVEVDRVGRRIFIEPYAPDDDLLPPIVELGLQAADRLCAGVPGWDVETGAYAEDQGLSPGTGGRRVRGGAAILEDADRLHPRRCPEPEPPAGVTRTVAESEADRRVLHSVFESSFAEHFGSVPNRYEDWLGWFLARQGCLPQTWWLAWLEWGIRSAASPRTTPVLIAAWATSAPSACSSEPGGRGIGGWLLQAAFADAARRRAERGQPWGRQRDASGAADLYVRNGMHAEQTIDAFRRPTGYAEQGAGGLQGAHRDHLDRSMPGLLAAPRYLPAPGSAGSRAGPPRQSVGSTSGLVGSRRPG